MLTILLSLALISGRPTAPADTISHYTDSIPTDTLHEVTVRARRILNVDSFPLHGGRKYLKEPLPPPSFGDILEKIAPGFQDKALHPFAIKQRKQERRRKRAMKALENLDRVKSFDELLREAYERQMIEDSLEAVRKGAVSNDE